MNAGILVLLGVTVVVLGCFARFFVALAQRSRTAAHLVDPHAGRDLTTQRHHQHPPYGLSGSEA